MRILYRGNTVLTPYWTNYQTDNLSFLSYSYVALHNRSRLRCNGIGLFEISLNSMHLVASWKAGKFTTS